MSRHARPGQLLSHRERTWWTVLAFAALVGPPGITACAVRQADRTPPAVSEVLPSPAQTSLGADVCWAHVPGGSCVPLALEEFRG